jgi:hypothetical protein
MEFYGFRPEGGGLIDHRCRKTPKPKTALRFFSH